MVLRPYIRERGFMDRLEIAEDKFWLGESLALVEILENLKGILKFYPAHMQREEKELFCAGMAYFQRRGTDGYASGIRDRTNKS